MSHTPCCGFHYDTYIDIAVVETATYGSYVMYELIVLKNTSVFHLLCDMEKYSTRPMNKVFA